MSVYSSSTTTAEVYCRPIKLWLFADRVYLHYRVVPHATSVLSMPIIVPDKMSTATTVYLT